MNTITTLYQNLLLARLPEGELTRIGPHLELVQLKSGDRIYEPNLSTQYAYFPITATIALLNFMGDGSSTEIMVIGKEGMLGISLFIGGEITSSSAVVQSGGFALRLSGYRLKEEFFRAGLMQYQLVKYTQEFLTQMTQTAMCNCHYMPD